MAQQAEVKFKLGADDQTAQAFNAILSRLENVDRTAKKVSESTMNFGRVFAGAISVAAVKQVADLADAYKNMNARLSLVTDTSAQFAFAQDEIFKISQSTRNSLETVTDLYTRLGRATQNTGTNQADLLNVTESISKALTISGASVQSSSAALIQLAQGLQSGTLRGQELNSVLEQTPRVAQAIADGLGMSIGQLRKFAEEGKLSPQAVIDALISQKEAIDREFGALPVTIGQAIQTVNNSITKMIGKMDEATGASANVSKAIKDFAGVIDSASENTKVLTFAVDGLAVALGFLIAGGAFKAVSSIATAFAALSPQVKALSAGIAVISAGIAAISSDDNSVKNLEKLNAQLEKFSQEALKIQEVYTREALAAPLTEDQLKAQKELNKLLEKASDEYYKIVLGEEKWLFTQAKILGATDEQAQFVVKSFKMKEQQVAQAKEEKRLLDEGLKIAREIGKEEEKASREGQKAIDAQLKAMAHQGNAMSKYAEDLDLVLDRVSLRYGTEFKTAEQILVQNTQIALQKKLNERILAIKNDDTLSDINKNKLIDEANALYDEQLGKVSELASARERERSDLLSGAKRGLIAYYDEVSNISSAMENATVNAFRGMEDAFVEFTKTGKLNFSDMANSIINDLIRIQVRQSIVAPLSGLISGFMQTGSTYNASGSIAEHIFNPSARAIGGAVQAGSPYIVGERGAELFVPNQSGSIVPNDQLGGSNVVVNQTINVTTGVQQTVRAEVMNMLPQIANAAKAAVVDAKMRGGSFASALR